MSRAVRKVPPDWVHPKDQNGEYIPLRDGADYERHAGRWDEEAAQWQDGLCRDYESRGWRAISNDLRGTTYAQCVGPRPDSKEYMPSWPAHCCTHWQMYEETSDGTPISPVCGSPDELARWLTDHEANAFGDTTASYQDWLLLIHGSSTFSAVVTTDGIEAGFVSRARSLK